VKTRLFWTSFGERYLNLNLLSLSIKYRPKRSVETKEMRKMEKIKNPKQAIEVLKEHLDINLSTDKLIIAFAEYIRYRHQVKSMMI
jgi:predicted RNA methylase